MPGARTKRIERIRKAMPFVDDLMTHRDEINSNWWSRHDSGEDDTWLPLPISKNNRDDDPHDVSNYRVAERELEAVSMLGIDFRCDAWPGGVIYTLLVRADDVFALRVAEDLISTLECSAYLDESDYEDAKWDHNHPSEGYCYTDEDDECSCDVAEQRREVEYHEAAGHVEILTDAMYADLRFTPELDADDEWYCETCDAWIWFSEEDKARLTSVEYRRDRLDMEAKGQLRLEVLL